MQVHFFNKTKTFFQIVAAYGSNFLITKISDKMKESLSINLQQALVMSTPADMNLHATSKAKRYFFTHQEVPDNVTFRGSQGVVKRPQYSLNHILT